MLKSLRFSSISVICVWNLMLLWLTWGYFMLMSINYCWRCLPGRKICMTVTPAWRIEPRVFLPLSMIWQTVPAMFIVNFRWSRPLMKPLKFIVRGRWSRLAFLRTLRHAGAFKGAWIIRRRREKRGWTEYKSRNRENGEEYSRPRSRYYFKFSVRAPGTVELLRRGLLIFRWL